MSDVTTAGLGQHGLGTRASIAIIGMACRLPGADDTDALWQLLASGGSAIRPIPAQRWDIGLLHDPERKTLGRTVNSRAGLIDGIDGFDAAFFGISSREACAIDPQQRLLLEETWHALEDAGLAAEALRGQRVGVYAAAMANDYLQHAASPFRVPDAYSAIGVYAALLANRLSAFFGWRGESVSVDSACASSLAALHQARLGLLDGSVDYCIVAAANALLSPWKMVSFSQAGMLSGDSLCKTFDQAADGYVPGEGAVVLVLRRTSDAIASGERIHGLLLGSAINHMGLRGGLTAPSVEAEAEVIRAALEQAGVAPHRLSYVECHGTGTALGDPIEVEALARALAPECAANGGPPTVLGSVKTNIGHLEAASGLAGVVKLLLMMRHGMIPPTINLQQDNPLIDFAALPLAPARTLTPWLSRPRIAGLSAFGFGGAGGHAIFAEPPTQPPVVTGELRTDTSPPVALALSAADETALKTLAVSMAERMERPHSPDLLEWGRALASRRGSLTHRILITARNHAEALAALRRPDLPIHVQGDAPPSLALRVLPGTALSVWRALRGQLPGLNRIAKALELRLRAAGFDADDLAVADYVHLRSCISLLRECGLEPRLIHAFAAARPAALAAVGVISDEAAAGIVCYGNAAPLDLRRPAVTYRDGDTGLELVPVRLAQAALQGLLSKPSAALELLSLGLRLWQGNHTFRAFLEQWREELGEEPGQCLSRQAPGIGLSLAVASALWATCARWSLRPPSVAAQWPAWPLAALVADGLVARRLALEVLEQARPVEDLNLVLAKIACLPVAGRHPWLEQQRNHLPEMDGYPSPLDGAAASQRGESADFVLCLGPESFAPALPAPTGRLVLLDPRSGVEGLEYALAELWYAGLDVHSRALQRPRAHLDLPPYPFTRKSYWLPRLPTEPRPVLWETGQALSWVDSVAGPAGGSFELTGRMPETVATRPYSGPDQTLIATALPPGEGVPPPVASAKPEHTPDESCDWVECVRQCVAATLEADASDIDPHQPLDKLGIDSLISMDLAARIERSSGVKLSPATVEQLGSVAALARRIAQESGRGETVHQAEAGTTSVPLQAAAVRVGVPGLLDTLELAELAPLPIETFPLGEARAAFQYMAKARHRGKIVLLAEEARWRNPSPMSAAAIEGCGTNAIVDLPPPQPSLGVLSCFTDVAHGVAKQALPVKASLDTPKRIAVGRQSFADTAHLPVLDLSCPTNAGPHKAVDMPLAVVGLSGRFPGAGDTAALWDLLEAGRCAIGEVPAGRWSPREFELCADDLQNPAQLTKGGFLADAESFDHVFFGFSPREARATDPRQRLLLEEAWLALHDAGLHWNRSDSSLSHAGIGVFVAADAGDYAFKRTLSGARSDQLALAGNLPSSLAARLAHVFDCAGPALTLDMACAASLGALWAAQQALLRGDCRCALVAAVSLHSTPLLAAQLAAAGLLSAAGLCLPFTLAADGFVPAEACVALVLKPLHVARADGDTVHAVLRGVAVGHDGHGRSFTLPSAASLAHVQAVALARAGVDAGQIGLVSAHGIGTRGGDAAELAALTQTFGGRMHPLPVTTLKPLLGHTLAAAGLSAVLHAILQIQRKRLLPVGLGGRAFVPEWDASHFHVPTVATPWPAPEDGQPRRVLLNTFALNGGQGAAIVEEAPPGLARCAPPARPPHTLRKSRFWLESGNCYGGEVGAGSEPTTFDTLLTSSGEARDAGDISGEASDLLMLRTEWQSSLCLSRQALTLQNESPQVGNPLPMSVQGLVRNISDLDCPHPDPKLLGKGVLHGLRTELAELLQESPEHLDLDASPIALGLSSILGMELQHRIRRRFGIALSLSDLLGAARMADLVPRLAAASATVPVRLADDDKPFAPFPLTDLQAAYWSGRQADVPLGGVDCQVYWEFECAKTWPVAVLEAGWNRLVQVHAMLRAVVDGNARQQVLAEVPYYRFDNLDLSHCPPEIAEERRQILRASLSSAEIDPGNWPLFRIAVSSTPTNRRLHCALNLLVLDVLSVYSLLDQLALLADDPAAALSPPAISFRQCLQALRSACEGWQWRTAERFWGERGPSLPPAPTLPMTKPLASLGRLTTRRLQARLSEAEWSAVSANAKIEGLSPSVMMLSVFAGILAHWTDSPRFTLNLTTHTRPPLHPEINRVVGNFTSTVLLDFDVRAGMPLAELAVRTSKRLLEHLDHAAYPGVQVLRRRAASLGWGDGLMPVVFTSMLGYEALRGSGKQRTAATIGTLLHGATRTPQVTLDAQVQTDGNELLLSWDVAEAVFPDGLPEAMFAAWVHAARALATPEGWEQDLAAGITRLEAQVRADANGATGAVPEEALYAPFLRQAAGHPERIAIIAADRTLSYGELAGLCADFALRIKSAGAQAGELVAVALEKGWRQVMAAIAVQMAGAAYLPLTPELPAARFTQLAERGGIRIGLSEAGRSLAWPDGVAVITVGDEPQITTNPAGLVATEPDSLAYVIFTSGSTGEPKGVMLSHRAALNTCLDINRRFGIGPQDRVLALSSLSFDLSVWDIFGTLAAGAALVLPKSASASDPAYLAELLRKQRVSVWNSVPMYLELFLAGEPNPSDVDSLRIVMLSGDWIALGLPGRLRAVAPLARVHSLGGATEAAIWSIHYPIGDSPRPAWTSVPYGRALDNQTMQVLDAKLAPCPDAVAGDLYIGGIGLALGYWRDPERTAEAFIIHPKSGERLYRTGDLARWREEGLLEFLGRRDGQVKIDGYRVELGEIEAALRTHPAVREAVAVAPADGQGRRRLAAFCLVDAETLAESLLAHLRARLPVYMLPKELRILDQLPLTDNDKVDRRTLADWALRAEARVATNTLELANAVGRSKPAQAGVSGNLADQMPETVALRPYSGLRQNFNSTALSSEPAPASPSFASPPVGAADALERRLLALWGQIISEARGVVSQPDSQRNLFELGVDSLMAVIASRRIASEFGIPCTVTEIFEHASIARLAKALADRAPQRVNPAPVIASNPPARADLRRAFRSRVG